MFLRMCFPIMDYLSCVDITTPDFQQYLKTTTTFWAMTINKLMFDKCIVIYVVFPCCISGIDTCQQLNNPCQNGGICTSDCPDYTCTCQSCWTGQNCDIRKSGHIPLDIIHGKWEAFWTRGGSRLTRQNPLFLVMCEGSELHQQWKFTW